MKFPALDLPAIILAGVCVAAAAIVLAGRLQAEPSPISVSKDGIASTPPVESDPDILREAPATWAERSYSALVERPLFEPSRRPVPPPITPPQPVAAPPPPKSIPPLPSLTLVGTAIGSTKRIAVLASGQRQAVRLAEGESYEGWLLERIEPQCLALRFEAAERRICFPRSGDKTRTPVSAHVPPPTTSSSAKQ